MLCHDPPFALRRGPMIPRRSRTVLPRTRHLSRRPFPRLLRGRPDSSPDRWLARELPRVTAYRHAPARLQDLPVTDKAGLMAGFHRYNRAGITAEQAWAALAAGAAPHGLTIGCSTGTSGNRGLFVISEAERYRWLGSILAKCLADLLTRPQRVAVVLPRDTRLYHSARRLPWLSLRFFDVTEGPDRWRATLEAFAPTVLLAPPRLLRHFAEDRFRLTPSASFPPPRRWTRPTAR